jgi:hypothetical protein
MGLQVLLAAFIAYMVIIVTLGIAGLSRGKYKKGTIVTT